MRRARCLVVLGLVAAVVLGWFPYSDAEAADADNTSPVLSLDLFNQLFSANTGGKSVCAGTPSLMGEAVYFELHLPGTFLPGRSGLYRRDVATGTVTLLAAGSQFHCGTFSADGALYAHTDNARQLVIMNLATGQAAEVPNADSVFSPVRFSDDHRFVVYESSFQLYRYDTVEMTAQRVAVGLTGEPLRSDFGQWSMSADGQRVVFLARSSDPGPSRRYVRDFVSGQTVAITPEGLDPGFSALISADGRKVAIVNDAFQVELVDLATDARQLVSVSSSGTPGDSTSLPAAISDDGSKVAFYSVATNLVAGGVQFPPGVPLVGGGDPLYVRDVHAGTTTLITRSVVGSGASNDGAKSVSMDRSGAIISFGSSATDLTSGAGSWPENPGFDQIYSYSTFAQTLMLVGPALDDFPSGAPYGNYEPMVSAFGGLIVYIRAVNSLGVSTIPYFVVDFPPGPPGAQTLIQDLQVVRPVGALVLTQRCGVYGSAAAYTDDTFGALPALAATPANADPGPTGYSYGGLPTGTAPTFGAVADPLFPQYPYPVDGNGDSVANYPTRCGIDLGVGKLITSGPKAGQYFTANGRIAQITVVNTQDVDNGWTLNGRMSAFTRTGGGDSFSGNLLGWNPEVTYDSAPNLDGYDMLVQAGNVRDATSTASTTGLGAASNDTNSTLAQSLAKSNAGVSLGMAVVDARLRLLIPVAANSGTYTGTLTFTTV